MSKIVDEERRIIISMDDIYTNPDDMIIGALLYLKEENRNANFLGFDSNNRAVVSVEEVPYTFICKGTSGKGLDMVQVFTLSKTEMPVNPEKYAERVTFIHKKYAVQLDKRSSQA